MTSIMVHKRNGHSLAVLLHGLQSYWLLLMESSKSINGILLDFLAVWLIKDGGQTEQY